MRSSMRMSVYRRHPILIGSDRTADATAIAICAESIPRVSARQALVWLWPASMA